MELIETPEIRELREVNIGDHVA
jgi:hypothetical protein